MNESIAAAHRLFDSKIRALIARKNILPINDPERAQLSRQIVDLMHAKCNKLPTEKRG